MSLVAFVVPTTCTPRQRGDRIRRRVFIAGLLAGLAMTAVRAGERPRIAILHSGYPERTPIHLLFEALQKLGHDNGRTATIELLGGEGNADRLNALVARLAAQKPDLIIAITSPAVLALKRAGLKTPVVFAFVPDPIGLGIVGSYAHPGGGFTGVTYSEAALGGKRLELLLDALPPIRRVAFFWSRQLSESIAFLDSIRSVAAPRGMEVFSREILGVEDLAPAFADAARRSAGGPRHARQPAVRASQARRRTRARPSSSHDAHLRHGGPGRRPDVLRTQHGRELPARRRLGGSHSQGRAPERTAGRAADHVRTGGQSQDGPGSRAHDPGAVPAPRRRGGRMIYSSSR